MAKIVPSPEMSHILNSVWNEIGMDVMQMLIENGKHSISRSDVVEIVLDCDRPTDMINRRFQPREDYLRKELLAEIELWRSLGYVKMKKIAAMAFTPGRYGL